MTTTDRYGTYHGDFDANGLARITWTPTRGQPEPVEHIIEHSPAGIAWGYNGSGPADTALSILNHAIGNTEAAKALHQQFKRNVVASLEINQPFDLPGERVANWLEAYATEPSGLSPREPETQLQLDALDHAGALPEETLLLDARHEALHNAWAALERREHELDQREQRLDERAAALKTAIDVEPKWSLPARPLTAQVRALQQGTGDPIDVVATGLGVEGWWARNLLDGKIRDVDIDHIQRVCEALHCSPYDLWGADNARTVLHAYGPELWPQFIEPLQHLPPETPSPQPGEARPPPPSPPQGPALGL